MPVVGTLSEREASDSHRFGRWRFRATTGAVLYDGEPVTRLTETESETLDLLIRAYPLPVPRDVLIQEMRRVECYGNINTIKVVIRRLRHKLGDRVVSTHAWGYRFNPEDWLAE